MSYSTMARALIRYVESHLENFNIKKMSESFGFSEKLLDEKWFENGAGFDYLFSKLLVQNDAMGCICDGRKWGAKYFESLSEKMGETEKALCQDISKHFHMVSSIAEDMMALIGDWADMEHMLDNFGDRAVRGRIGKLIDTAKSEDTIAYEQIKLLSLRIPYALGHLT